MSWLRCTLCSFERSVASATGVHETFVYALFLALTGLVLTVNLPLVGGLMIFKPDHQPRACGLSDLSQASGRHLCRRSLRRSQRRWWLYHFVLRQSAYRCLRRHNQRRHLCHDCSVSGCSAFLNQVAAPAVLAAAAAAAAAPRDGLWGVCMPAAAIEATWLPKPGRSLAHTWAPVRGSRQ